MNSHVFDKYAEYYDVLYQDKNYGAEAMFVDSLVDRAGGARGKLLEFGCGTGGHAIPFARRGWSVAGYDLSEAMVTRARSQTPVDVADLVDFRVGDVRTVDALEKFDAVASLFHVASYQTADADMQRFVENAARHLRPGGIFIFDFWYGPAVLAQRPTVRVKRFQGERIEVVRVAEPIEYPNENCIDVVYNVYIRDRERNALSSFQETHRMRYFFAPEIRALLKTIGFKVVNECEWMTGAPLDFSTWSGTIVATVG